MPTGMALFVGSEEELPVSAVDARRCPCRTGHGLQPRPMAHGGAARPSSQTDTQGIPLLRSQDRAGYFLTKRASPTPYVLMPGMSDDTYHLMPVSLLIIL